MVFSFHGGGGSMDYQANDAYYGQISKSEQAGYIAVFPNGFSKFKSGNFATWNAGKCCAAARDENVDDVGFVRDIIKNLRGQLNIDPNRIFADGISNGGMMAYRLACEMSDVFKAIASVAGTDNTKSCFPKAPISILHIHARNDDLELFDGGAGRRSSQVTSFVSVPDSIAKWVRFDGCSPTPKRVFENSGAYCDAYSQCRGGVEVELCVTATGGHSWPGGKKPRGDAPTSTALSATDVIWDFFNSR
jgi:polyhydroxybutyrate depolymerase